MVELPLQNVKATAVLEIYRKTHVKPSARKCDECKNKLKCRIGITGRCRVYLIIEGLYERILMKV